MKPDPHTTKAFIDAGNKPRRWQHYFMYPRVFLTGIVYLVFLFFCIGYWIYAWLFAGK